MISEVVEPKIIIKKYKRQSLAVIFSNQLNICFSPLKSMAFALGTLNIFHSLYFVCVCCSKKKKNRNQTSPATECKISHIVPQNPPKYNKNEL